MYKFFRENQKRLLAFFGVILMIAFVMPSTMKNPGDDTDRAQGRVGNTKIMMADVRMAEEEWHFLSRNLAYQQQDPTTGRAEWLPVTSLFPDQLAAAMQERPETYYLLQYEAKQMGFVPKYEDAERGMADGVVAFREADGRYIAAANLNDRARPEAARVYLGNLLMVRDAFMRASRSIKLSEPLIKHQISQQFQQIKVRVAEFLTKDYEASVGTPTAEQLQKQFDQYADTLEETGPTEANPFGFGYNFPNRVKLQYIAIPRDEVRKAIKAQKTDYQWEVEANTYYIKHQGEFISTSAPASQPGDGLSLGPVVVKPVPTTKPFADVREEAMTRVVEPLVERLQGQIQTDLVAWMNRDYDEWLKAHPNGPSTAPSAEATTGPAAEFESFAYLQKLAQEVLKRHKVTITVASITDSFKSTKELNALPGIGKTEQFGEYAVLLAQPFQPAADKDRSGVLKLFKSSAMRADELGNRYFFRLTATEASHKPASLDLVKEQVDTDWKKNRALELAKADAQKLLEAAKTTDLEKAAGERKVIQTGEFASSAPAIENYSLTSRGTRRFAAKTYEMLESLAAKTSNRPVTLIDIPTDGKVVVAELVYVDSAIKPEIEQSIAQAFTMQMQQQLQSQMSRTWFNQDAVAERVGYVDSTRAPAKPQAAGQ